jgi:hypothetical protein
MSRAHQSIIDAVEAPPRPIVDLLRTLKTVVVATFTRDGALLDANDGFLEAFGEDAITRYGADVRGLFVEPRFRQFTVRRASRGDSTVYRGHLEVGPAGGQVVSLTGTIYGTADALLLVAEHAPAHLALPEQIWLALNARAASPDPPPPGLSTRYCSKRTPEAIGTFSDPAENGAANARCLAQPPWGPMAEYPAASGAIAFAQEETPSKWMGRARADTETGAWQGDEEFFVFLSREGLLEAKCAARHLGRDALFLRVDPLLFSRGEVCEIELARPRHEETQVAFFATVARRTMSGVEVRLAPKSALACPCFPRESLVD